MKKSNLPSGLEIKKLHDEYLLKSTWPNEDELKFHSTNSIFEFIEGNHFFNTRLWNEEDLARRKTVSDSEIAQNKRAIDKFNQSRNDFIEKIDDYILGHVLISSCENSKQNSETLGAMIDRLSILSLKIFHMTIQTKRTNVLEDHIIACSEKLKILMKQRDDLCLCFDDLIHDCIIGLRYFKQYKQFKMYNDPNLNPQIYIQNID
jgi:hypothetical protein